MENMHCIVIDETCPDCQYPELLAYIELPPTDNPKRPTIFFCYQDDCGFTSKERPSDE